MDSRERCLKCKAALVHREELALAPEPSRFSGLRGGWRAQVALGRLGRRVKRAFATPLPRDVSYRYPIWAAFLALAPGAGQVYNHQSKKILFFLPPFLGFVALAVHFIKTPYFGNIFVASAISVLMLSYADALVTAARINGQFFSTRNVLAACTYPFFLFGLLGVFFSVMSYFKCPILTNFRMNYDYMAPALRDGDRVCGEGITFWFRDPAPGDVVHYDPPDYSVWRGSTLFLIDPQNGWERVMAAAGETLEYRDGVFRVDGQRLARDYYPLLTKHLPPEFRIVCPEDAYIILTTWRAEDTGFINRLRGGDATAPGLGGKEWEKACVVAKGSFFKPEIFDRTLFIYHPTVRRRGLTVDGPRFEPEPEGAADPAA